MYLIPVEVKKSTIEGNGVFALQKINKGEIVWRFEQGHDKTLSVGEFMKLDKVLQEELERVAYLSPMSGQYVYPPENDPARFTNHSRCNNLTVVFNDTVSTEPYFVANKSIEKGEELTNNYFEFDKAVEKQQLKWI